METFNKDKFFFDSNYHKDTSFTRLRFGYDMPILESDLNEMQVIQEKKMQSLINKFCNSGFVNLVNENFSGQPIIYNPIDKDQVLLNHIAIAPSTVIINGYELKLIGNKTFNNVDDYILIDLGECPEYNDREDLIYLEAWFENIDKNSIVYKNGYINNPLKVNGLNYSIIDPRIMDETSRKVALVWTIKVAKNIDFKTFPDGLGYKNSYLYSKVFSSNHKFNQKNNESCFYNASHSDFKDCEFFNDYNLYVAGKPDKQQNNYLNYNFAMPLFRVKRRNKNKYSLDNPNGAISYHDVKSFDKDSQVIGDLNNGIRPDKLFYDQIYEEDIMDLRKTIFFNKFNYNLVLNENLYKLMTGELKTSVSPKMKRIQFGNKLSPYNSNNVVLSVDFNKNVKPFIPGIQDITFEQQGNINYKKSLYEYGLLLNDDVSLKYPLKLNNLSEFTIDFFIQPYWHFHDKNISQSIISILNRDNMDIISFKKVKNEFVLTIYEKYGGVVGGEIKDEIKIDLSINSFKTNNINHIRLAFSKSRNNLFIYLNGKLIRSNEYTGSQILPEYLKIGELLCQSQKGCVIEDLIVFNRAFEKTLDGTIFTNDYWPMLDKDFISEDSSLLPSLNGMLYTLSDNPCTQYNTCNVAFIRDNQFTISTGDNSRFDENDPLVLDMEGKKVNGTWNGANKDQGTFTVLSTKINNRINMFDLCYVHNDLDSACIPKYTLNIDLANEIIKHSTIVSAHLIPNKRFGFVVEESLDNKLKIKIKDIDDNVFVENIPGLTFDFDLILQIVSPLNLDIAIIEFKTPILTNPDEVKLKVLGNIPHIHYSEELKNSLNITLTNENYIVNNKYLIFVSEVLDNNYKVKIIDMLSQNTLYENFIYNENIQNVISVIPGLELKFSLFGTVQENNAIIIETRKTKIIENKFMFTDNVNDVYNYDANLKDHLFNEDNFRITNAAIITSNEYDLVVSKNTLKIFKYEYDSKNILNLVEVNEIPGIFINKNSLPINSYDLDAVKLITFDKSNTKLPNYEIINKFGDFDRYSEILKTLLVGWGENGSNINITNKFNLLDASYDLIVTNVSDSLIKIVKTKENNIDTEEILYEGHKDINTEIIPGVEFRLGLLPDVIFNGDKVRIDTISCKFGNLITEIKQEIPFVHYSDPLNRIVSNSLKIDNVDLIETNDFLITLNNKENIVIQNINTEEIIYDGQLKYNINNIPGILFDVNNYMDENGNKIDDLGSVILSTKLDESGIPVIVKYNLVLPPGNGGYELMEEILGAALLKNDKFEEIAFNKINAGPRMVNYLKPKITNGKTDVAYDYSYSYRKELRLYSNKNKVNNLNNYDCFSRVLEHYINGNGTRVYRIPRYIYGQKVLGVMEVDNGNTNIENVRFIDNMLLSDSYYEVTLSNVKVQGETIKFKLALEGIAIDYDVKTKTLMTNIVKTKCIEFESTGKETYTICCLDKNEGGGILEAIYNISYTDDTNVKQTKYIAYINDQLLMTSAIEENEKMVFATFTVEQSNDDLFSYGFGTPFIKIRFDNIPASGTKIKIYILMTYQPKFSTNSNKDIISIWYKNSPYQGILDKDNQKIQLLSEPKYFITTLSSGQNYVFGNNSSDYISLNNVINRLPGGLTYAHMIDGSDIILEGSPIASDLSTKLLFTNDIYTDKFNPLNILNTKFNISKNTVKFQDGYLNLDKYFRVYFKDIKGETGIKKYIGMACLVQNEKREVFLLVIGNLDYNGNTTNNLLVANYGDLFKLEGNPTL